MASFPGSLVSYTNPQGGSLLTSPDHAGMHTSENNEIVAIETFLGTNSGTNIFSGYQAGWFPLALNGGTPQIALTNGTFNQPTINGGTLAGTIVNANLINLGTYTNSVLPSPTFTKNITNNGTITGGTIVNPVMTGGTINGTLNSITNLGTSMFQIGQFLRLGTNSNNYFIQQGTYLFGTIAGNNSINTTVTFPVPYTTIPVVITSTSGGTGAPSEGAFVLTVNDTLGTASFVFRLGNLNANPTGTMVGNWIAIGY